MFASAPTDLDRSASVSQFDPALGTLLSVDIVAEGSLTSDTQVENLGSTQANVKAVYDGALSYQVQGLGQSITSTVHRELSGTVGAYDGNMDFAGTSGKDLGAVKTDGQFNTVSITDAGQLAAFIGTGSMSIAQQASANACSCGPGNLLSMVKTTAEGKVHLVYHYTPSNEIGPGKYTIVETQPPGRLDGQDTPDNVAPIPGSEKTDIIPVTVVSRTDTLPSNNFGEFVGASISGQVYQDVNRDGALNGNDLAIPNVPVALNGADAFGNAVSRTTATDAAGAYSFAGLLPGNYLVTETQPAGYQQGNNTVGSLGGTVNGDQFNVAVKDGDAGVHYDFGETVAPVVPPPPILFPAPPLFGKYLFFGALRGM